MLKGRALVGAFTFIAAMAISAEAAADDFWCTSYVSTLGMGSSNDVFIGLDSSNGGNFLFLCNMNTPATTPTYQGCQAWYSTALTAKAAGKPLVMRLQGTLGISSCAALPANWQTNIHPVWLAIYGQ